MLRADRIASAAVRESLAAASPIATLHGVAVYSEAAPDQQPLVAAWLEAIGAAYAAVVRNTWVGCWRGTITIRQTDDPDLWGEYRKRLDAILLFVQPTKRSALDIKHLTAAVLHELGHRIYVDTARERPAGWLAWWKTRHHEVVQYIKTPMALDTRQNLAIEHFAELVALAFMAEDMNSGAWKLLDEAVEWEPLEVQAAVQASPDYTGGPQVEVRHCGNTFYGYAVPNPEGRVRKATFNQVGGKTWVALPYLDDYPANTLQLDDPKLEWRLHGFQKHCVKPFTLPLTFAEMAEEWRARERRRKGVQASRVTASLDPWRRLDHDIDEALQCADAEGAGTIDAEQISVRRIQAMPIDQILRYDDYSSWGEWRPGELKDLPPQELRAEMVSFRGKEWAQQAQQWLDGDGIPAVVLVDLPSLDAYCLGDGRGRVSLAVGLGIRTLPAAVVTERRGAVHADLDDDLPSPEDIDSIQAVKRLAPQLAAAAQTVYDAWQQDQDGYDEELGSGGICDGIAEAMQDCLSQHGVGVEVVQFFDEYQHHRYLHVLAKEGVFELDIPHRVYETGGGYNWKKKPDVVLDQHDVWIARVDDFQNWPQYRDAEM